MLAATNQNRPLGILTNQTNAYHSKSRQLRRAEQYRPLIVAMRGGVAVRLSASPRPSTAWKTSQRRSRTASRGARHRVPSTRRQHHRHRRCVRALLPELQATLPGGFSCRRSSIARRPSADRCITCGDAGHLGDSRGAGGLRILESLRATLVPALVVPVSLIGTFSVMYLWVSA